MQIKLFFGTEFKVNLAMIKKQRMRRNSNKILHTKLFFFLLTEFKANLAMISASHVNAWSRQLDGPVPEQRTKLIYQIINFNELVYVLLFVVCLNLSI